MGEQKSQQGKPTGKTVNMKFPKDTFYNDPNTPLYRAGVVYQIDTSMQARWEKRGGVIVTPAEMGKGKVVAPPAAPAEDEADKKDEAPVKTAPSK